MSVPFAAFGLALPTFNFGFFVPLACMANRIEQTTNTWKSFFLFSFFFFELDVMSSYDCGGDLSLLYPHENADNKRYKTRFSASSDYWSAGLGLAMTRKLKVSRSH